MRAKRIADAQVVEDLRAMAGDCQVALDIVDEVESRFEVEERPVRNVGTLWGVTAVAGAIALFWIASALAQVATAHVGSGKAVSLPEPALIGLSAFLILAIGAVLLNVVGTARAGRPRLMLALSYGGTLLLGTSRGLAGSSGDLAEWCQGASLEVGGAFLTGAFVDLLYWRYTKD